MKTFLAVPFLALSLAAWAPSCGGNAPAPVPPAPPPLSWDAGPPAPFVPPPAPTPAPVPPPPVIPPDDSCAAMCAHLARLKCPAWSVTCDADCARRDANLVKLGSKPSDHSCVSTAESCVAAGDCK